MRDLQLALAIPLHGDALPDSSPEGRDFTSQRVGCILVDKSHVTPPKRRHGTHIQTTRQEADESSTTVCPSDRLPRAMVPELQD